MAFAVVAMNASTSTIYHSESADSGETGFLAPLLSALYDTWVEAVIIAFALHVYCRFVGQGTSPVLWWMGGSGDRGGGGGGRGKKPKAAPEGMGPIGGGGGADKHGAGKAAPTGRSGGRSGSDVQGALTVQRLVATVLRRAGGSASGCAEALAQYERIVREQCVDLRAHIPDDQNARSLYTALVECGIREVVPDLGRMGSGEIGAPFELYAGGAPPGKGHASAKAIIQRLLKDMSMFGFPRGPEFYANIFRLLTSARLHEDSLWLHDAVVADKVKPDRATYVYLLSVATCLGHDTRALTFFRELCKSGPPAMRTYMTVLRIFSKRQDWRGASALLDGLRDHHAAPDALVLNTVLGLCVSAGEIREAERLLTSWEASADTVSCNILIKGYAQKATWPSAERLLEKMLQKGPAPNIITFNTMMDCAVRSIQAQCGSDRHRNRSSSNVDEDRGAGGPAQNAVRSSLAAAAARPWQLLDQLLERGLEPDRYTCSTLVKGMHLAGCTSKDIDRMVALLHSIGKENLHAPGTGASGPDGGDACNARLLEVLFNTILDACVSIRDPDRMASIFEMMGTFEVGVSAVTFGTLIKAFGQAGKLSRCHEVWQNMRESKVTPTVVTYGCYIDACTRNSDIDAATRIFGQMIEEGIRPNAVVYTSLIRACAHAKMPLRALELYKEMRDRGIEATAVTFNSVLDIVARQLSDPEKLREVMEDMRQAAIEPDVITYSILVKANCNVGNLGTAISLFRQLRDHGLVFDEVALNTLLLACSNAGKVKEAEDIFAEMRDMGVSPTHVTTSIMVKMYGKAKQLDKAIEVSRSIEERFGSKPNLFVYTCLIQACVRNKQVRKSWDVFCNMLCSGVMPDAITYGTAIQGCIYHNKFQEAMALLRHAYATPGHDGRCVFKALSFEPTAAGAVAAAELAKRHKPLVLQRDVLNMLIAALHRKGFTSFAAEAEALASSPSGFASASIAGLASCGASLSLRKTSSASTCCPSPAWSRRGSFDDGRTVTPSTHRSSPPSAMRPPPGLAEGASRLAAAVERKASFCLE